MVETGTEIVRRSGLLVSMMLIAPYAQANEPGVDCQSREFLRYYDTGFNVGNNLVERAWRSTAIRMSCYSTEELQDAIERLSASYLKPRYPTVEAACRTYGVFEGMIERLAEIQDDCWWTCILDGDFIGELAAILYCELAIALRRVSVADDFIAGDLDGRQCGRDFTIACQQTFAEWTHERYDDELNDAPDTRADRCSTYTVYPWRTAWRSAQEQQCLVDPQPASH